MAFYQNHNPNNGNFHNPMGAVGHAQASAYPGSFVYNQSLPHIQYAAQQAPVQVPQFQNTQHGRGPKGGAARHGADKDL